MKILAFDASTRFLSLALADGKNILRYRNLRSKAFLSSSIVPNIRQILTKVGWTLKDLDGIFIGLGPGSFTSLRVGLSTAKALAFANDLKVVGISSLDLIAMNVKSDGNICVMMDARRGLVYSCCYEKRNGMLRRLTEDSLQKPEDVFLHVKKNSFVIGDALPIYKALITNSNLDLKCIEDAKIFYPDARHLITLGTEDFKNGKALSAAEINPIYLYPENCQVRP